MGILKFIVPVLILCAFGAVGYAVFGPLSPHRALPLELRHKYTEYHHVTGPFASDFIYCLTVTSTEDQFVEFSRNLGLRKGTGLSEIPSCNKYHTDASVRWDDRKKGSAQIIFENTNTDNGRGEVSFYEDGVLYFIAWDH